MPINGTYRSNIAEQQGEEMVDRVIAGYALYKEWHPATVNGFEPWDEPMADGANDR